MTSTLTPLVQSIAPVTLTTHPGRRRPLTCTVDARGVEWCGQRVEFDDLTSVAYSTRARRLNIVQRRVERRIRLIAGTNVLAVNLGHRHLGRKQDEGHQAIYNTVVASLYAQVEPRLRAEAIRSIAAGGTVRVGPLCLSHADLRIVGTNEHLEWRQLPVAQLEGDKVVVRAAVEREPQLCVIDMLMPGAVLLPELLAEATIPFA